LDRLAAEFRLVGIVGPQRRAGPRHWLRRPGRSPFAALRRFGAPLIDATAVEQLRPDIVAVASYPAIVPPAVLAAARAGAFNVHMSLLPRHRGADPIFWTYWDDDANAGVTVHWMTGRIDAGDIAAQASLRLERGLASRELYMRLTALGVELLARVVRQTMAGEAVRAPQDEALATYESAADIEAARLLFAEWPAERVWHVLRGLGDQRHGLVSDGDGRRLRHGRATALRRAGALDPGRIEQAADGFLLHCRDGIVAVERLR
jgi:methionyl-tRNA formyltransferase